MVRVTSKNRSNSKGNKTDSGIASAIKAFSSIDFRVPTFKKKANSLIPLNKHTKSRPAIRNGSKSINNLLKNRRLSNKKRLITDSHQIPFIKLQRNKPQRNYTTKSSHLTPFKSKLIQNDDYEKIKPKNNKKKKRALRRKQLKQQIEKVSIWKFNQEENNGNLNNDENKNSYPITKSPKHTPVSVIKTKRKKNNKHQVQNDQNNLTTLFKSDSFDLNPLKYTNKMLNLKKKKKKNEGNINNSKHKNNKKINGKKSVSLLSEKELKKQIAKQLCVNKTKFKLSSNAKCKKKIKTKNHKSGKYIERKIKQKMSEFAKTNQKNRRWRH